MPAPRPYPPPSISFHRHTRPEGRSDSAPLFSSIKLTWSLKRGVVQRWVVTKLFGAENTVYKTAFMLLTVL